MRPTGGAKADRAVAEGRGRGGRDAACRALYSPECAGGEFSEVGARGVGCSGDEGRSYLPQRVLTCSQYVASSP